jgi:sec-independent protein translocase protein TatC
MPFLDHLEELRWRLIYSLIALMIGLAIGFILVLKFNLIEVIQRPATPYLRGQRLVITTFSGGFSIVVQLSLIVGVALALPVVGYQVWAFLAPALHRREKQVVIPALLSGVFLFAIGVALAYFVAVPLSLKFFNADVFVGSLTTMYTATDYFSLVTTMCIIFGVAFEVPMLLVLLTSFGVLTPEQLSRMRKWAFLIIFTAAAAITPGDAVTPTVAMALPLYVLYELSVAVSYVIARRRKVIWLQETSAL